MSAENKEREITLETRKRFSESALWRLQRDYFEKAGINAWVSQVPFYITSNPFIANCYAKIFFAFIRDWIRIHPDAKNHPFYIMELGTGSGRFSFYLIKTLCHLLKNTGMQDIKFCYIMSDFTKNNIQYYETHPALKSYIEQGVIDFAIYNMESERPITLLKQNITLTPDTLVNPLSLVANYIFDTISQDAFTVRDGKLYELVLTLKTPESNTENNHAISMDQITTHFDHHACQLPYYNAPHLDDILAHYIKSYQHSSFLFPIGTIRAIQRLRKLTQNKLFILSSDKGYNTLESMDNLGHPGISFHGSFSMMVNFHAISNYIKNSGGDYFLQTQRKGIKTAIFVSGVALHELPETQLSIQEHIEGLSPADYFTLHKRMSDSFNECSLESLSAHLNLALWDPHMFLKLLPRILILADSAETETIDFLAHNMEKIAANYYHMPKSDCVLFEIGIFFHAIKRYAQAIEYFEKSKPYLHEQLGLHYNLGLCHYYQGDNHNALENFQLAAGMEGRAEEVSEWIKHLSG